MIEAKKVNLTVHVQLTFSKPLVQGDDEFENEVGGFLDVVSEEADKMTQAFLEAAVEVHPTILCDVATSTTTEEVG